MTDAIARLNAALEGRYRVEGELGEGGMATVYLADDLKHGRKVALKVLKPELAAVVGGDRFLAEIKTTANLQHPHILPLHDSGEADGFLYYVMPYIEGETLRDRLDREHQLPVDDAVRIATNLAEALDYAHRQGVIHRDIKPANVLLLEGKPVISDFGIALAVGAAGGGRLTETGLSLGTPHYMSPEQATGDTHVGPPTDIYALGCVLYEMLVGEPPFTGSTPQAVLGRIITGTATTPSSLRATVAPHVDAVVARALERIPADRFESAQAFCNALADVHFRHGRGAEGAAALPGGRLPAFAGWAAAAMVAALWIGTSLLGGEDAPPVRHLSLATGQSLHPSEWIALTPDGSALVAATDRSPLRGPLVVRRLDDLSTIALPGTEGSFDLLVTPDGSTVVFTGNEGLKAVPVEGGAVRRLTSQGSTCCVRWGGDGYVYYTTSDSDVYRVTPMGGDPELLREGGEEDPILYYQPLPGSGKAVLGVAGASSGEARIDIIDVASGDRVTLTDGARPWVTGSGYLVFVRANGGLFAAPLDVEGMRFATPPIPVAEDVGYLAGGDAMYTLSASGDLIYWRVMGGSTFELAWVDRSGAGEAVDPAWTGDFESVEISPDGTRALVTRGSLASTEVWLKDLDRGPARRLTSTPGMNRRPVWAPDGNTIAFISNRGGPRAVYSMPVDGLGSPRLLFQHPTEDVDEALLSPDGEWLIYRTGTTPGNRDIFARRLGPDTATIVVSALPGVNEVGPSISPNGRWLAYVSDETGRAEIWVRPFPDVQGGRRQLSLAGGFEPVWSPDGRELFYRGGPRFFSVPIESEDPFSTGEVRELFVEDEYRIYDVHRAYSADPDQERLLMLRARAVEPELILVQNFLHDLERRIPR